MGTTVKTLDLSVVKLQDVHVLAKRTNLVADLSWFQASGLRQTSLIFSEIQTGLEL